MAQLPLTIFTIPAADPCLVFSVTQQDVSETFTTTTH